MIELFHDVEDLEDTEDLHKIYEVFKSMSKSAHNTIWPLLPRLNTLYIHLFHI